MNRNVWSSLAQAARAQRHSDVYAGVVVAVIELDKDTDAVACVAGAIAVTRSRASMIPVGWTGPVHGVLEAQSGTDRYALDELTTSRSNSPKRAGMLMLARGWESEG